jgi:hypothetical protein
MRAVTDARGEPQRRQSCCMEVARVRVPDQSPRHARRQRVPIVLLPLTLDGAIATRRMSRASTYWR